MIYDDVDTPELRSTFEHVLASQFGATVRVQHDPTNRWVEVDLTRDGVSAWLMTLKGEHGQRYFDCEGRGVEGLDAPRLVHLVVCCFRNAERLMPS